MSYAKLCESCKHCQGLHAHAYTDTGGFEWRQVYVDCAESGRTWTKMAIPLGMRCQYYGKEGKK